MRERERERERGVRERNVREMSKGDEWEKQMREGTDRWKSERDIPCILP